MRWLKLRNVPLVERLVFHVARVSRRSKLALFYTHVGPRDGESILDVGVAPVRWSAASGAPAVENFLEESYQWPQRIVALSVDCLAEFRAIHPQVRAVQGDACCLPFADRAFDIVFTNAVIEHVGDRDRQLQFVRESLRVARRAVFLAAPNAWFPYDTHVGFPFVHWLPRALWRHLVEESQLYLLSPAELLGFFPPWSRPQRLNGWWAPSIVVMANPRPVETSSDMGPALTSEETQYGRQP